MDEPIDIEGLSNDTDCSACDYTAARLCGVVVILRLHGLDPGVDIVISAGEAAELIAAIPTYAHVVPQPPQILVISAEVYVGVVRADVGLEFLSKLLIAEGPLVHWITADILKAAGVVNDCAAIRSLNLGGGQ